MKFLKPVHTAEPALFAHDAITEALDNLIVYELNPYAFTSPDGAGDGGGSGTFAALSKKLDYLHELGITGIWMAGHSEATTHFHNIPTVYACKYPDKLDPRLGTEADFKVLTEKAHTLGIKIFLDVITHGLVKESSLINDHPDWFEGESWGMIDYDYDNPEFREWWISVWVKYVLEYGVDGFRLDGPNGYEDGKKVLAVWDDIKAACAEAGKPIIVFGENGTVDFRQGGRSEELYIYDMAKMSAGNRGYGCRAISNHDSGHYMEATKTYYRLIGSRAVFGYSFIFSPNIPLFMSGEEFDASFVQLPDAERKLLGGEEFDASFVQLPDAERKLLGGGGGGDSVWLYASWIQWDQLNDPGKKAMLDDCRKIIRIKHENSDILCYNVERTKIVSIDILMADVPNPYLRYIEGEKAILVAANYNENESVDLQLELPLVEMGMDPAGLFRVTNLWTGETEELTSAGLGEYRVTVPADKTPGGGVRAYKIEAWQ